MTKPAYTLKQLARAPNVVRAAVIENERCIADLEAENARLQADKTHLFESIDKTLDALAEALGAAAFSPEHTDSPAKYVRILTDERNGYKALAEQRGEAVEALSRRVHHKEEHPWPFEDCMRADCSDARAALAATPELTNG